MKQMLASEKSTKIFSYSSISSAEFLQFSLKHLLPLSVLTSEAEALLLWLCFCGSDNSIPEVTNHKTKKKLFLPMKQQMKHNKIIQIILLSHACNCKKFLWSECGSDYISLSQNKHGAKERIQGGGESLSLGHPQETSQDLLSVCASHGRAKEVIPAWWSFS